MKKNILSRRGFLKGTGVAAAALGVGGLLPKRTQASIQTVPTAWTPRMAVNDQIDNLRAVIVHDPLMVKGPIIQWDITDPSMLDIPRIEANIDEMAMSLAQKPTALEAWQTIFRKPAGKQWNQVRCAIKVTFNNGCNDPRVPPLAKICKVLIGLGVTASNICIYDDWGNPGDAYANVMSYFPAGLAWAQCKNNDALSAPMGGMKTPPEGSIPGWTIADHIPPPIGPGDLIDGNIDILVSLTVIKAHNEPFGGSTLTMKNHFGTLNPGFGASGGDGHGWDWLVAINKSNLVFGGTPVRQQLAFLDGLWANNYADECYITGTPARLLMSTFAPALDYLTCKATWDIPEDPGTFTTWRSEDAQNSVNAWLPAFGYTEAEVSAMAFVDVPPAIPTNVLQKPTSIAVKNSGSRNINGDTYTIQGQRIRDNKTGKGISIKNGKKSFRR